MTMLWYASLLMLISTAYAVDLTLEPGAYGKDVVAATLERLANADIFADDFDFLRNIALAESNYGVDGSGSSPGGIWRIPEWAFLETFKAVAYDQLWEPYANMAKEFDMMWDNTGITYEDMDVPLLSVIAARLFLLTRFETIPIDVEKQAEFWKQNYNHDGDLDHFIRTVEELLSKEDCRIALDIVFALDGSSTVGEEEFKRSKDFVIGVLDSIGNIGFGEDQTRVAVLEYSNEVWDAFPFDKYFDIAKIKHAVQNITFHGGGTGTGLALANMRRKLFSDQHGARSQTLGIPKVGVLVTDGKSNIDFPVYFEALRTHKAGITMYAIGVGAGESEGELQLIASKPYNKHVFRVNNNDDLKRVKRMLQERSCTESAPVEAGQLVSGDLKVGESKFLNYGSSSSEGITLSFQMEEGSITVYTSSEIPNPNSAQYDNKILVEDRVDAYIGPTPANRVKRNDKSLENAPVFVAITANSDEARFLVNSQEGNTADPQFTAAPIAAPVNDDALPAGVGQLSFQHGSQPGAATTMFAPTRISLVVIAVTLMMLVNMLIS